MFWADNIELYTLSANSLLKKHYICQQNQNTRNRYCGSDLVTVLLQLSVRKHRQKNQNIILQYEKPTTRHL